MKKLSGVFFALTVILTIATGCRNIEHSEAVTADITAAQMEGRDTARRFIVRIKDDTTGMHRYYLETTDSCRRKYAGDGKTECVAAFDSTFVSTVRTVRPDVVGKW